MGRIERLSLSSNKRLYTVHMADIFDTRSEEGNNQCIQHITQYLENRFVFPLAYFEVRAISMITETPSPHLDVFPALPKTIDVTTASLKAFLTSPATLISATNHSAIHSVNSLILCEKSAPVSTPNLRKQSKLLPPPVSWISVSTSIAWHQVPQTAAGLVARALVMQAPCGPVGDLMAGKGMHVSRSRFRERGMSWSGFQERLSGIRKINYFHHECWKPGKRWSGETSEDKRNCMETRRRIRPASPLWAQRHSSRWRPQDNSGGSLEPPLSLKLLPVKLFTTFKPKSPTFSKTWK
ncbi:hypothetical protein E5288_WYG021604 [Bos mutus]|uniref:Uncharacterized protein n=1 Tax=Bos mutus TaxID=72004 RepID=A0A6B0RWT2_9CETA|nr:hypothetical protein [Bos mutus]